MGVRTDIHRPAAINPAEYDFIAVVYHGNNDLDSILANADARQAINNHMKITGGKYSQHEHGGSCHVCGAHAVYLATFYHAPSNTYIKTGEDCAGKLEMEADFNSMRRAIGNAREALAGKKKAKAILADAGLDAAWTVYEADLPEGSNAVTGKGCWEELTIKDIVGKLVKYGSVSDKQLGFVRTLVERIPQRAALEAKRAEEKANAANCPTGRVEVTGTVLKTEYYDSNYGETLKMVVKDDSGFLVFGTVPSSLQLVTVGEVQRGLEKGNRVKFTANVTPGDRDPKFGFYKRPTKASIL